MTDNGVKFQMSNFNNQKGVIHQKSCFERPQQNEHKHQHLLNVARSLLFQASLPLQFMDDSILITTYLINRTPTPLLDHKSPYKMLYSKILTYSHLKSLDVYVLFPLLTIIEQNFHPELGNVFLLVIPML